MNITIPKFAALIAQDYSLDVIYILDNIEDIPGLINFPRGGALLQRMFRKGLVDEKDGITEKGKELLRWVESPDEDEIRIIAKPKTSDGLGGLHKTLENKLIELTGKKQIRVDILGSKYSFLCNDQDLQARVKKVMAKYRIADISRIEGQLLKHIEKCHKTNRWYPLIIYYLLKSKEGTEVSQLITDMNNTEESEQQHFSTVDI